MNKYLYIVNPVSGKGKGKKAIKLIESFHSHDCDIVITNYPKHATDIVKKECNNYKTIISVGGDGTLNEIINGFELGARSNLAVLPVGSGNDFVKNINYNKNIKDTLSLITNNNNKVMDVDRGKIEFYDKENSSKAHYFINNLGIGFDAYVGFINLNNKVFSGLLSYLYAVVKALFNYQMVDIEYKSKDNMINGKKLMVSIGNGVCSGGGFYLNPNAIINDGVLDISIFDKITRRRLLAALPMALINKLDKVPEAKMYMTDYADIKLKNPYFVHCDGEIITTTLKEAKITIQKKAVKILTKP